MVVQALCDVTFISERGTSLYGIGEHIVLPLNEAYKALSRFPAHLKIVEPTPLLAGVEICWSVQDRLEGPCVVQLLDGCAPERKAAVQIDDRLCWVEESCIVDINPWPLLDALVQQLCERVIAEGQESPRVAEVVAQMIAAFGEDEP